MSDAQINIHKALLTAQSNIGKAVKGASNPFFKSKYADLGIIMEVVKKPLNDAGIAISQEPRVVPSGEGHATILVTALRHTSGEVIESSILIPECKKIQDLGSAITYLKRYALQAMLFVPSVDDDGEAAMSRKAEGRRPTKSNTPF